MTNITGKIYQMKNADGTENRFPRTVIEAVLGLSSYLQDQFSSLADIYMPIGGIYQSKTGQEFVYRATPNTIKAKSFTLDRIRGKSLAWNQLVPDSHRNFVSSIADAKSALQLQIQWYNDSGYINSLSINSSLGLHVIIARAATGSTNCRIKHNGSTRDIYVIAAIVLKVTSNHLLLFSYNIKESDPTTVGGIKIDDISVFDLTLLYGSEIDGMTDAQILEKFESEFPGYYSYNPGTLISNDAEAVETTWVNQWDEELELGQIVDGSPAPSSTRFRSKNFCKCIGSAAYYLHGSGYGTGVDISWYDSGQNYITRSPSSWGAIITAPSAAAYFKICVWAGTTYNHNICINLSDTAKNGTYEPYRKSTLPLNLDDFWVKDGQGNQVHITGGLKSAGSVYDEIVGNKYIKRVGSVDLGSLEWVTKLSINRAYVSDFASAHNAKIPETGNLGNFITEKGYKQIPGTGTLDKEGEFAMIPSGGLYFYYSGTNPSGYMYYELATPIEYDLVEPLIYTMKAGTTEARISPNSDGLSAPFCCDMTYSANENNDACNAQYAATAGRLLNTHKIWGQDFNGSEDVDGNLVANGTIQGTQLKSTVATGTAPLTVASTTMVQNLVAEKASKLLTARTIWGQSFDGGGNISGAISNITTLSASGLATIAGGIALGTSTKAQEAKMVWDEINNAWHLQGNLYADGFVSAYGTNESEALEALKAWVTENFEPKQS